MSNGSTKSSVEPQRAQARRSDKEHRLLLASCLAVTLGCNHPTLHQSSELQSELTNVTAEDLFLLGVSHAHSGDFLRAEQYLAAARQRGHEQASAIRWLVRVCIAASRYQSALRHAHRYLRENPRHWSLRLVVASLHEALGDSARAKSELEYIVRAEPDWALPHYRLAMLYRDNGDDRAQINAQLEQYLELAPDGHHAPEAQSFLDESLHAGVGPRRMSSRVDASPAAQAP